MNRSRAYSKIIHHCGDFFGILYASREDKPASPVAPKVNHFFDAVKRRFVVNGFFKLFRIVFAACNPDV